MAWAIRKEELVKKMTMKATRTDHAIVRNFNKLGLLDGEPILRREIDAMLAGTGVCHFLYLQYTTANSFYKKFHLALLSDGNPGGMEKFIAQEANRRINVIAPVNVPSSEV